MKKSVPHFFTALNLICGCAAILLLSKDNNSAWVIFCLFAFLFDFADGFFARLLKTESPMGKQLDSFSDFLTSGVVPGIIMYKLLVKSGLSEKLILPNLFYFNFYLSPISLVGFLVTIATAFRLSKFNLMENEHKYFVGQILGEKFLSFNLLLVIILISIYLLNSKLKLVSLKNINILISFSLFCSIGALVILTNYAILTIIIFLYILGSLIYFHSRS